MSQGTPGQPPYYADVVSYHNYYPFGMLQPGRSWTSDDTHRFLFNGKESDNEVSGTGNQYDYGFRIYNPRIAKFLSVDPLTSSYPELTPYQFASNTPIQAIDLDGLESRDFRWAGMGQKVGNTVLTNDNHDEVMRQQYRRGKQWMATSNTPEAKKARLLDNIIGSSLGGVAVGGILGFASPYLARAWFWASNSYLASHTVREITHEIVWGFAVDVERPTLGGQAAKQSTKLIRQLADDASEFLVENVTDDFFNATIKHIDIGGEGRYPGALNFTIDDTKNIPNRVLGFAQETLKSVADNSVDLITLESGPLSPYTLFEEAKRVLRDGGTLRLQHPIDLGGLHQQIARDIGGAVTNVSTFTRDGVDYIETTITITK